MEDKIIQILSEETVALDVHEIESRLGFNTVDEL